MSERTVSDDLDPRVARTRRIVLEATVEELTDVGFERVTIDAIADRCGVARSTIYRNWPERVTLLAEAFRRLCKEGPADIVPSGSLKDDLLALGRLLVVQLTSDDWSRTVPSLISGATYDDALGELLAAFSAERHDEARVILDRAVVRGEIAQVHEEDDSLERFVAPFFFRRLISRRPLDEDFIKLQVDVALSQLGMTRGYASKGDSSEDQVR